jgi:hypothetical protein
MLVIVCESCVRSVIFFLACFKSDTLLTNGSILSLCFGGASVTPLCSNLGFIYFCPLPFLSFQIYFPHFPLPLLRVHVSITPTSPPPTTTCSSSTTRSSVLKYLKLWGKIRS